MPTSIVPVRGRFCKKPRDRVAAFKSASDTSSPARAGTAAANPSEKATIILDRNLARIPHTVFCAACQPSSFFEGRNGSLAPEHEGDRAYRVLKRRLRDSTY